MIPSSRLNCSTELKHMVEMQPIYVIKSSCLERHSGQSMSQRNKPVLRCELSAARTKPQRTKMDCTIIMCKLFVLTVNGELTYLMADNHHRIKLN